MKFLCVSCDEPMKLTLTKPPERGSLTVVFQCPTCGHELAMLTNPYETQVVASLGVKVGGSAAETDDTAKCPFSGVVRELSADREGPSAMFAWTPEAASRLQSIPEFARPMAKAGIERFAKERGLAQIDGRVLDEARDFFGM